MTANLLYQKALLALKLADHAQARTDLEAAARLGHVEALTRLGDMLLRWPGREIHPTPPDTERGLRLLVAATRAGSYTAARTIMRFAKAIGQDYRLAIAAMEANQPGPEREIAILEPVRQLHPEVWRIYKPKVDWIGQPEGLVVEPRHPPPRSFDTDRPQTAQPIHPGVRPARSAPATELLKVEDGLVRLGSDLAGDLGFDDHGLFAIASNDIVRNIVLYIPDHSHWSLVDVGENPHLRNKLHITDCSTIDDMKISNRFERYVVSNRLSGAYRLTWPGGIEQRASLRICINCLVRLNELSVLATTKAERLNIAANFDVSSFVHEFGAKFAALPARQWLESGD